jgi:polar amino acid transport system substrate-binding protein
MQKRPARLGRPLAVRDYYLQVSHPFQARHLELTLAIWKALADIRRTELDRLTAKYMRFYEEGPAEPGLQTPATK